MTKVDIFVETWTSYEQIFVCLDNSRQNIWIKVRKSIEIGQDLKNLITAFAYFLTAMPRFYFWK